MLHVKRNLRIDCSKEHNCIRALSDECKRCIHNMNHLTDYFEDIRGWYPHRPYWYWDYPVGHWVYSVTTSNYESMQSTGTSSTALCFNSTSDALSDNYKAKD